MFDFLKHNTAPSVVDEPEAIEVEPEVEPEVEVPQQIAVQPSLSEEEFLEYARVAKAIGLDSGVFQNEELLKVLRDENISIYDLGKVHDYMNAQAGEGKWTWRPLRSIDFPSSANWTLRSVKLEQQIYNEEVPLPVLHTVEKILQQMPDAQFFVSYAEELDDPFLMVSARHGGECVVIERWDEPSFRG